MILTRLWIQIESKLILVAIDVKTTLIINSVKLRPYLFISLRFIIFLNSTWLTPVLFRNTKAIKFILDHKSTLNRLWILFKETGGGCPIRFLLPANIKLEVVILLNWICDLRVHVRNLVRINIIYLVNLDSKFTFLLNVIKTWVLRLIQSYPERKVAPIIDLIHWGILIHHILSTECDFRGLVERVWAAKIVKLVLRWTKSDNLILILVSWCFFISYFFRFLLF